MESDRGLRFVNDASVINLLKVEGVGRRTADAIVAYRNRNGPFKLLDDLKRIDGVGEVLVKRIRHASECNRTRW